jgi:two-component system sensor histidine kinase VicK
LELTSLPALVKTAVAGHMIVAQKQGLSIDYRPPQNETDLIVAADTGRINQVIDNLIGNAIKFSPDGGVITVDLSDQGENVLLSISDEGVGVPQDKIDRIFERFYQVDGSSRRRFGGTGLGLAIVKRIIDAHHGKIWVESAVNQGSTFHFTLPKEETVA